jgi:K+-sensing histidine kinase KdpD
MFKNILIPISSEFYNKEVLERSAFLAEKFNSKINIIYIIEEKTLNQTDKLSDTYRTEFDIKKTKREIIKEQMHAANGIVFDDAKTFLKNKKIPFEEKIIAGQYSNIIKNEIKEKGYDLVLMAFEKACLLNYRLLDELEIPIPIWAVSDIKGDNAILAVCSNLAPNKKVPDVSIQLSKQLGWKLHMIYVIDFEDAVEVDETLVRSMRKTEFELVKHGEIFAEEMKKQGIQVKLIKGNIEKEMLKMADKLKTKLIIIGRQQKKKGILGIPMKNMKKRLAEKCQHSILFVN